VAADGAENRKQQLDAWKRTKNQQGNKENQDNNNVLHNQVEKLQQELNQVKSEMQKGKVDAQEIITSMESKIQLFLRYSLPPLLPSLSRPPMLILNIATK
jgi:hypothetical protein